MGIRWGRGFIAAVVLSFAFSGACGGGGGGGGDPGPGGPGTANPGDPGAVVTDPGTSGTANPGGAGGTGSGTTGGADPSGGTPTGPGGTGGAGGSVVLLNCPAIFDCIGACAETDAACANDCYWGGTIEGQTKMLALTVCMEQNGCVDGACAQASCPAELTACENDPVGGAAATPSPAAPPAELVGEWRSGTVSAVDFYSLTTGSWAPPSGVGESYVIRADGTFIYAGLSEVSLYACTTKLFTYAEGTVTVAPAGVTFQDRMRMFRSEDSCSSSGNYERPSPLQTNTHPWRIESDAYGTWLYLTSPNPASGELRYRRN